jgi:tetratricopeptide (TPR) repeat protein
MLGDHQRALTSCEQALALHRQLGDPHGQAHTWDSLGYAHHHLGHHGQAITCYRNALAMVRDLGDHYQVADTLSHLGDTHYTTGDPHAARDAWQQALTILKQLNHPDAEQVGTKLATLDTPGP